MISPDDLSLPGDALFVKACRGQVVDIPTGVGFCMYIHSECLNRYGLFGAAHYGCGYGKENDFSMRVAAEGWRNCLCADLSDWLRAIADDNRACKAIDIGSDGPGNRIVGTPVTGGAAWVGVLRAMCAYSGGCSPQGVACRQVNEYCPAATKSFGIVPVTGRHADDRCR